MAMNVTLAMGILAMSLVLVFVVYLVVRPAERTSKSSSSITTPVEDAGDHEDTPSDPPSEPSASGAVIQNDAGMNDTATTTASETDTDTDVKAFHEEEEESSQLFDTAQVAGLMYASDSDDADDPDYNPEASDARAPVFGASATSWTSENASAEHGGNGNGNGNGNEDEDADWRSADDLQQRMMARQFHHLRKRRQSDRNKGASKQHEGAYSKKYWAAVSRALNHADETEGLHRVGDVMQRFRARVSGQAEKPSTSTSRNPFSVNVPVSLDARVNTQEIQKYEQLTEEELNERARVIEEIEAAVQKEDTEEGRAVLANARAKYANAVYLHQQRKASQMQEDVQRHAIMAHNRRARRMAKQREETQRKADALKSQLRDVTRFSGVRFEDTSDLS